ncbi:hypothetical protein [Gloeothece verrucosa]|uniref:Luciferase family protein n=1 Tax=Gloeothece verrucosa (strain PCC 7822) TaxID=497965 RepID=E0UK06_GLOV7|nr:hypothetical protein [Gloeothece verrucosa]ADN14642.1 luciferase family protein [Gloeothece verrucosa PCC 7822]
MSLELMLDNIRREWSGSGQDTIEQLLNYVYSTAPMIEVKDNRRELVRSPNQPNEKIRLNLQKEREKLMDELGV